MTHFSVAVVLPENVGIDDADVEIDRILNPYCENENFETVDRHEECLRDFEKYGGDCSLDEFAADWGYHFIDGRYYKHLNLNAKWDWWQIGGRWTGFYPIKDHTKARVGVPGILTEEPKENTADIVRVSDLNWDAIRAEAIARRTKFLQDYQMAHQSIAAKEDPNRQYWKTVPRAKNLGAMVRVESEARPKAKDLDLIINLGSLHEKEEYDNMWEIWRTPVEAQRLAELHPGLWSPISTWAVVHEGKWTEPGSMGWFASSDETPEQLREFKAWNLKLYKELSPDRVVAMVDCHI